MAVNLLIASLAVFFAAAMVGMFLVSRPLPQPAPIPVSLWVATALVIATSVALQLAIRSVRRERQAALRFWLITATLLGCLFFAAQGWGLWQMTELHQQINRLSQSWILLAVLVGLHSAHVAVGLGILLYIVRMAIRGRFDHEYYLGLSLTSRYWHFLDAVWLAVLVLCAILLR